jgi:transcriptional regulator with XRE-family HTH domain
MPKVANLLENLGQRIASYRVSRNLKQAELASSAGLDRTTISRLESGKATLDTLARVLVALEIEQRLPNIVPDPNLNPLDPLEAKGRQRQRVRDKTKQDEETPWAWGDDA